MKKAEYIRLRQIEKDFKMLQRLVNATINEPHYMEESSKWTMQEWMEKKGLYDKSITEVSMCVVPD